MLHKKRKPSTFTLSSRDLEGHITTSQTKLHSKSTYFYRWIPVSCSLVLLFGTGVILNPAINSSEKAHAGTITANPTDYSSISLTISNNGTELNTGDTVSTDVQPGFVNYISNNLKIDTKKINRFYVSVQAAEDGTSELTGTDKHATIAPVGSNKIPTATGENGFGDNTWGFALGETSVANESMVYNSLPVFGTSTTPDYSSANNLADGSYNLKLTFAAKINADKPNDHYTTKAIVSVAADAKNLVDLVSGLGGVKTMQQFTSATCKSLTTPSTSATAVPTGQLVDTRDNSVYWVAKLADGDCWMTQNMAYSGISDASGNFNATKRASLLVPNDVNKPTSYGEKPTTGYTLSYNSAMTGVYDDATKTYNGHYLRGNYYEQDNNQALDACTFTNNPDWKLPTAASINAASTHGSYGRLLGAYNVSSGNTGTSILGAAPLYFLCSGSYGNNFYYVGTSGFYWSSDSGSLLNFSSSDATISDGGYTQHGVSVRCVVSGA